jgi:hypothetical protein
MKLKNFNFIRDFLWTNKESEFDYPHYAGLPKKWVNKLSCEDVDAIQQTLCCGWHTKKAFSEELMYSFTKLGCIDSIELLKIAEKL